MRFNIAKKLLVTIFFLLTAIINIFSQVNISNKATCTTSFVSSWENLNAIKDGYIPLNSGDKGPGAYGNWNGEANYNKWNWVQYTFSDFYKISKSDVYWWTDGQGIALPVNAYIQYWSISKNAWVEVPNPSKYGLEADKFNQTEFDTILTNQIRLNFISSRAQGILEWRVFGELGEQIPYRSTATYNQSLSKGKTTTYTIRAYDKLYKPVKGYVFNINANILNAYTTKSETYIIDNKAYDSSAEKILLPPADSTGKVVFDVTLPENIRPTNGIELTINFSDGKTPFKVFKFQEPGLSPPAVIQDNTLNNVDNTIELTFTDNVEWRGAVTDITSNGLLLNKSSYKIEAGKISITPDLNNNLSLAGQKTISIIASGYADAVVNQTILAGKIDTLVSQITSRLKLFKNVVNIPFKIKALDKFGNAISGISLKWQSEVKNLNKTNNEVYTVNGISVNGNLENQEITKTLADGTSTITVSIPSVVNIGDGITIRVKTEDGAFLSSKIDYLSLVSEKQVYIDNKLRTLEWSYSKSAMSDNFVVFWGGLSGTNPQSPANGNSSIAFDPLEILDQMERYLALYVDTLGFITNKNVGNMAKYRFPVIINETWNNNEYTGYAFGGSTDGVIGAMWVNPSATKGSGFVLAHEFAHMCQAMIPIQYPGKGIKDPASGIYNLGMFWESHANFMGFTATGDVERANPQRFVNTSMLHFSSTSHYYENNFYLQYLYDKYGMEVINKIWRNATQGMHPLLSHRINMSHTQDQLNDEFGDYAMHNVTWDYSIKDNLSGVLKKQGPVVVCREYTIPDTSYKNPGWYVVPKEMAPADYGYNIIPLFPDENATKVGIDFSGFANAPSGGAGWRFGLVAVDKAGKARYSNIFNSGYGEIDWASSDSSLFLVVTGAPKVHHNYVWNPGWPKIYRYPYSFKVSGAIPAGHKPGYNNRRGLNAGRIHSNGGGWVASTASVSASSFVGKNAQVLGKAIVTGNARIEDYAIVTDNAEISGSAVVRGNSIVGSTSKVKDRAIVEKSARVYYSSSISGDAVITGSAIVYSSSVSGNARVKDLAWLNNANISGTAVIGGDAEDFTTISSGTYLQDYELRKGDGLVNHYLNIDVNPSIAEYDSLPTGIVAESRIKAGVYPNPASDFIIIESPLRADVSIYDLSGKCLYKNVVEGKATLPVSAFGGKGSYIIQLNTTTETRRIKLLVK